MRSLDQAERELDACSDIQSNWKHLRSRLHEERLIPLRRHLQSLRDARPQLDFEELEEHRRRLRRLPLKLRPRLWRYRAANSLLRLTARLLRRRPA